MKSLVWSLDGATGPYQACHRLEAVSWWSHPTYICTPLGLGGTPLTVACSDCRISMLGREALTQSLVLSLGGATGPEQGLVGGGGLVEEPDLHLCATGPQGHKHTSGPI
ncbi:hypothetical protein NDU88_006539 [Pleurodeles waltl]|uniref:Uncharacterized protein n=1 Tax=Pleurodeles waltl TaxID=8319 RepID=A0AAV7X0Y5_PLEWA|nr:hypothetical protein NDU88_006539 [Pleurodeles waltl]